jgi:hypothetical protein
MGLCGPSTQEKQIESSTQNLGQSLQSNYAQRFGQQSKLLQSLNDSLSPIVAAGPSQTGFSPEELAARNTTAINNAGAANIHARQAAGNAFAGQGGGSASDIVSGIHKSIEGDIASASANELANTQNAITGEDYAVGRSNYDKAVAGAHALSGEYDPKSFAEGADSSFGSAFKEANTIQQERGSQISSIIGTVGSLASSFAGGIGNLDTTGASSGGEQALNFFNGMKG